MELLGGKLTLATLHLVSRVRTSLRQTRPASPLTRHPPPLKVHRCRVSGDPHIQWVCASRRQSGKCHQPRCRSCRSSRSAHCL